MLTGNKFNEEFAKRRIEESPFHKLMTPSICVPNKEPDKKSNEYMITWIEEIKEIPIEDYK